MSYIKGNSYNKMIEDLKSLLKIPSVMGKPEDGMPFGRETFDALKFMLDLGKNFGFETKNVDGYAGHIEWGSGEEIFGVLCHLDVVPVGDGWTHPPFEAVTENGKIYARGTLDDKSPAVAVLYAVKRLKDEGFVPKKKFRLIMGLNEESGWKCIDYYMAHEKMPDSGFSPDADFPVINREKGVLFVKVSFDCEDIKLIDIGGGTRVNMVADKAFYTYDGKKQTFTGISAHGSLPHKGINALHSMFNELKTKSNDKAVEDIYNLFCSKNSLENLGLDIKDTPSGNLTQNFGLLEYTDKKLVCNIDIRFPVTFTKEFILEKLKENLPSYCSLEIANYHRPLYIPEDDSLILNLLNAYEKVTDFKGKCISIGGATYARALDKCVAFGPVFPDEDSKIHTADECIDIERLFMMTDIYYEALKSLL